MKLRKRLRCAIVFRVVAMSTRGRVLSPRARVLGALETPAGIVWHHLEWLSPGRDRRAGAVEAKARGYAERRRLAFVDRAEAWHFAVEPGKPVELWSLRIPYERPEQRELL